MIYLFTGTPGSGKSLNAIRFVDNDTTFKNRPVYYHNIKDLTLGWTLIDLEQALAWFELPEGSVIILDECQEIFPPRSSSKSVPQVVSELNTHRHKGYDIVLITQHPNLIDNAVRRLVGHHTHIERKFGLNSANHYTWPKAVTNVDGRTERSTSDNKIVKFDKKYFEVYKSAEVHTHKARLPMGKLAFPVIALCVAVGAGYFLMDSFASRGTVPEMSVNTENQNLDASKVIYSENQPGNTKHVNLATALVPEIPDLPFSAPIYNELMVAKDFPRPTCIYSNDRDVCQCYSQQVTKMDVSKQSCMAFVENGFFDFTKPVREDRAATSGADRGQVDVKESNPKSMYPLNLRTSSVFSAT